jgi:DNA-binding HxlR family transcriptional regulator
MTIAFTRTREQLADLILGKLGVKDTNTASLAADLTIVYEAMDLRLKEMHRLGTFWRTSSEVTTTITTTAATAAAAGPVDVLYPIALWVTQSSYEDQLTIINAETYASIDNKTEVGIPTHAFWKANGDFLFWPVSAAASTINLLYQGVTDDTAASTAPDIDVSMMRWFRDIVAYDLGDQFGASEQRMARFEREALRAERNIRALQVQSKVDYLPVMVDTHRAYFGSRFKRDWNTG